jgi:hypothetical protein
MAMRNSFLVLDKFSEKKSRQFQRKVGKFGQISKIIIFTYLLDAFFLFSIEKKSGRFEEKSGKTQSSKLK